MSKTEINKQPMGCDGQLAQINSDGEMSRGLSGQMSGELLGNVRWRTFQIKCLGEIFVREVNG